VIEPFLLALLAFLAILPILLPLLKGGRPVADRAAYDQAVYRDQLQELERDVQRGLATAEDTEASRIEIQRRILAADRMRGQRVRLSRSPVLGIVVVLVVGVGSVLTYLDLGTPGLPDVPFASRPRDDQVVRQRRDALEALARHLQENPKDAPGWLQFARGLAMMGDYGRAEAAYGQAIALGQDGLEVQADRAEMMVMVADGTVTPAAGTVFQKVLATDPANPMAQYYLALGQAQAGEPRRAVEGFQKLLTALPSDSPMRGQIGKQIADAARQAGMPVPELAQGAAPATSPDAGALTDAQRDAMIRGMVAQLAAKQAADPGNFDGWMRLGRAYAVLGEMDQSSGAYAKAQALRPDDLSVPEAEAEALMTGFKPGEKLPDRVIALMNQVVAKDPKQPMALWYLGLNAAQNGQGAEARQRWQALADQLPSGSDDRKMVEQALATLPSSADTK
jgi:cytochrome c-type biogenesis protein CcmH